MISSRPSHMSAIIVIFETSPSGANEPNGPVMPNPGPPLPSALAATASVSSAVSGTSEIAESIAITEAPAAQKPT